MPRLTSFLAAIVVAMALAACGGGDDESTPTTDNIAGGGGGGGESFTVVSDPDGGLSWSPTEIDAAAGPITLELENESATPHNIEIEGATEPSETITDGATASVTADLQPATYTFYCDIPGHEEAGMTGTLTVK